MAYAEWLAGLYPGKSLNPAHQQKSGEPDSGNLVKDLKLLIGSIDFSTCPNIVDMFSGMGIIAQTFTSMGHNVVTNDIDPLCRADLHQNALQHAAYHSLLDRGTPHAIVMSPDPLFLDLTLPLAIAYAFNTVCCRVPGEFLSRGPDPRQRFIRDLESRGLVLTLQGQPVGLEGRRQAWLVVFKSLMDREDLVRHRCESELGRPSSSEPCL